MTVSAHDVAAALNERLPGLPDEALHDLLRRCQDHHLATFGRPLFIDGIPAGRALGEAELNTIGYTLSKHALGDDEEVAPPVSDQVREWLAGVTEPVGRGRVDTIESIRARLAGLTVAHPHITVDPGIRGGEPCIRGGEPCITGTRVPARPVAELVADGVPPDRIEDYYAGVTTEAAEAAAAWSGETSTQMPGPEIDGPQ